MNGVINVFRRVVGDVAVEADGQFLDDGIHFLPHALDDVERVGVRQNPDAHEYRAFAAEAHFAVVIFRAERDIRDIAQPHELIAALAHDEIFEFLDGA